MTDGFFGEDSRDLLGLGPRAPSLSRRCTRSSVRRMNPVMVARSRLYAVVCSFIAPTTRSVISRMANTSAPSPFVVGDSVDEVGSVALTTGATFTGAEYTGNGTGKTGNDTVLVDNYVCCAAGEGRKNGRTSQSRPLCIIVLGTYSGTDGVYTVFNNTGLTGVRTIGKFTGDTLSCGSYDPKMSVSTSSSARSRIIQVGHHPAPLTLVGGYRSTPHAFVHVPTARHLRLHG
ncbi:MAG: hypothetical protein ABW185_16065 [Sedimenticola sp.]